MWCQHCRQHVATSLSYLDGATRCARCQRPLGDPTGQVTEPAATGKQSASDSVTMVGNATNPSRVRELGAVDPDHGSPCVPEPVFLSAARCWELDEELRHVDRLLNIRRRDAGGEALTLDDLFCEPLAPKFERKLPVDEPAPAAEALASAAAMVDASPAAPSRLVGWISAASLYLGAMALTCGGALAVWSRVGGHPDLWRIGLPGGIAGLGGFLVSMACRDQRGQSSPVGAGGDSLVVNRSSSGSTTRLPANPPSMARHISAPK
jgi:hypothetical protein